MKQNFDKMQLERSKNQKRMLFVWNEILVLFSTVNPHRSVSFINKCLKIFKFMCISEQMLNIKSRTFQNFVRNFSNFFFSFALSQTFLIKVESKFLSDFYCILNIEKKCQVFCETLLLIDNYNKKSI